MAKSLRAWSRAAGLLRDDGHLSEIAKRLFVTHDPYLEYRRSVALLHWLIASNCHSFTAAAWVFNHNRKDKFTVQSATSAFRDYLAAHGAAYATGTLQRDLETVLRMHASSRDSDHDEIDDRFFSQLRLVNADRLDRMTRYSRTWEHSRPYLSTDLLVYALLQSLARRRTSSSALSTLHMGSPAQTAPGAVFGLSRDGFFAMTEHLVRDSNNPITLSTMPGEDAMIMVTGEVAAACTQGNLQLIDERFFDRAL